MILYLMVGGKGKMKKKCPSAEMGLLAIYIHVPVLTCQPLIFSFKRMNFGPREGM